MCKIAISTSSMDFKNSLLFYGLMLTKRNYDKKFGVHDFIFSRLDAERWNLGMKLSRKVSILFETFCVLLLMTLRNNTVVLNCVKI